MKIATQIWIVTFLFIVATQLQAEDKTSKYALWKWSSDSSSKSSNKNLLKTTGGSQVKGPQLNLPRFQAWESAKATTGRAFNSARNTTSRIWNSSVNFLNPWDDSSRSSKSKSQKGDAWFFRKKDEQPQYSTVNDFLRQERPKF